MENPLRPKEIQDRIRAGETADEIADAAGIPIDRVRRFEGPVLAEREYRALEAQRSTVRGHTESGPGPRLGEIVGERLSDAGAPGRQRWPGTRASAPTATGRSSSSSCWRAGRRSPSGSSTRGAGTSSRPTTSPGGCACPRSTGPPGAWAALGAATATVTPIGSRFGAQHDDAGRAAARAAHAAGGASGAPARQETFPAEPRPAAPRQAGREWPRDPAPAAEPETAAPASPAAAASSSPAASERTATPNGTPAGAAPPAPPAAPEEQAAEPAPPARPGRKSAKGRRSSVPSWDEIMLGNNRND